MLHKIVDWIAYKLHIKERKVVDTFQTLLDLLPLIYAISIVVGAIKWLGTELPPPPRPWYKRLWYWLRLKAWKARATVIGY